MKKVPVTPASSSSARIRSVLRATRDSYRSQFEKATTASKSATWYQSSTSTEKPFTGLVATAMGGSYGASRSRCKRCALATRPSPANERLGVRLGALEADQVAGVGNRLQARAADLLREEPAVQGRDEAVRGPPHDQGRRRDAPAPPLEPERLHHVEAVQEEIELVLEVLESRRLAEAREERGMDAERAREQRQRALPRGDAACPVEEEEGRAVARLQDLDSRPGGAELDEPRQRRAHGRAPRPSPAGRSACALASTFRLPGLARRAAGRAFGHQRSSHSFHMGRRCGSTSLAQRYVDRFTSSIGADPMWRPSRRWPTRSERDSSSSCWRTVAGEPATM